MSRPECPPKTEPNSSFLLQIRIAELSKYSDPEQQRPTWWNVTPIIYKISICSASLGATRGFRKSTPVMLFACFKGCRDFEIHRWRSQVMKISVPAPPVRESPDCSRIRDPATFPGLQLCMSCLLGGITRYILNTCKIYMYTLGPKVGV